ncbi:response regulator [Pelagicoccus sp. SDUM812003]|uniref:response regulator n=1 Tax=Pelagicoccus sp. SDUM812003 TaxID=3041267 RepID=UPI00280DD5A3|nr:response regulator [Pelagicoccus sp. SDUM812003]MDQ8202994.1 response regulator [Pelagicoccus sp. SDUM812003]
MKTETPFNSPDLQTEPIAVLVVDDSVHDFRSLTVMINSQADKDYAFTWARNSEEAESKLEESNFDLVAMDYNLGLELGTEAIERLAKRYPEPAYILVTGNQDPDVYKEGIRVGAVNFVQKNAQCGQVFDRTAQFSIERQRSENALKLANASKDWVMSLLETDLASPLFSLNQLLSTMMKEAENMPKEMLIEMLDTAYQSSCEAVLATNELMDWGRSLNGAMHPAMKEVNIASCIQSAIRLLTTLADERGVFISQSGIFEVQAFCDERMVGTVARNLIAAALSFTAEAGTVRVSSAVSGEKIAVSVVGDGRSLRPKEIAYLREAAGAGIEFSSPAERQAFSAVRIASHMLDSMGSSLEVRNVGDRRTAFSFSLPMASLES